jgi:bifunctional UDP-N-acetylglucosamine pyrophosphorylase/glucosamine-1-phosphate N-acetyltransferase
MLAYVIEAARAATGERPLVVYSAATQAIVDVFRDDADFALQDEPRGTADAVRAGLDALDADLDAIVVLSGDVPLIEPEDIDELAQARLETGAVMALLTVDAFDPEGLGRIVRDADDRVIRIVEEKDATPEERQLTEINAGVYAFDVPWLRKRLPDVRPSPATGELYLPALVELARADHRPVAALQVEEDGSLQGINDRSDLASAELEMRLQINERHMLAGVTMLDPARTHVDATVTLAEDVTLEASVVLRGTTSIGRDTVVRIGSQLFNAVVGEGCLIWSSVIEDSVVEDGSRIGPLAHIRGGSHIGQGAEVGNFAEVKASRIGRGTKQHHFSYIGDADLGSGVNIGAGTITANYDGRRKHRTTIGDGAFIGSDTILRAPITVGPGAYTGAGSVVTRDVPAGKIAVGVPARIRERVTRAEDADGSSSDGSSSG